MTKLYLMYIDDYSIETDQDVLNCGINLEDCINQLIQHHSSIKTIIILDCCRVCCSNKTKITNGK